MKARVGLDRGMGMRPGGRGGEERRRKGMAWLKRIKGMRGKGEDGGKRREEDKLST